MSILWPAIPGDAEFRTQPVLAVILSCHIVIAEESDESNEHLCLAGEA